MIDDGLISTPAPVIDGPAFGPVRWRGWRIAGIAMLGLAGLYLVQVIVGVILIVATYLPYARLHPGVVPNAATLTKMVFTAPALFAMVVPGEALMAFLAIVLVMGTVGATRANIGLGRRPRSIDVVIGFFGGCALIAISSLVAYVQTLFFGPHPQPSVQIIMTHHGLFSFFLDFVTVALAAGVCEEIMFRGVVFASLAQRLPLWAAAALSGLIFAAAHFDGWSLLALWSVGIGLGLLYYHTRSLWPNMVAHTLFNAFTLVIVYWFPQFAK